MRTTFNGLKIARDDGRINPNAIRALAKDADLMDSLISSTAFLVGDDVSVQERIYAIVMELTAQPVCATCSNPTRYVKDKKRYPLYCCVRCARIDPNTVTERSAKWDEKKNETIARTKITKSNATPAQKLAERNKRNNTMIERYGGWSGMWTNERLNKRSLTNLQRYGVAHASQSGAVREKISSNHSKKLPPMDIDNRDVLIKLHHHDQLALKYIAELYDVSPSVISERCKEHNVDVITFYKSTPQIKIERWLESINVEFRSNDRAVISPHELDIFIPSHNIAIEVDGIRWHSELHGKDRRYHLHKTNKCLTQNVQLLHFWDIEVVQKWEIVTSMIKHKLGMHSQSIGARKCEIVPISSSAARSFCDENHIQGGINSTNALALKYNEQMVAIAAFGPSRFERNVTELLRFCTLRNVSVPGGLGRLVMAYVNQNKTDLVTYCDKRYGTGIGYSAIGFERLRDTPPNYSYHDKSKPKLLSRQQFQKHLLHKKLQVYNPILSEWDNMQLNGYDRVWDCGHSKWVYRCK